MMKKIAVLGLLAGSLALAGCNATTGSGPKPPVVTETQVSSAINTVQQTAVKVCGYLPAVQTVTGILATFSGSAAPFIEVANVVANGICRAVTSKSSALNKGFAPPSYKGIVIQGDYVRK